MEEHLYLLATMGVVAVETSQQANLFNSIE
jgi:hypothetical protein